MGRGAPKPNKNKRKTREKKKEKGRAGAAPQTGFFTAAPHIYPRSIATVVAVVVVAVLPGNGRNHSAYVQCVGLYGSKSKRDQFTSHRPASELPATAMQDERI